MLTDLLNVFDLYLLSEYTAGNKSTKVLKEFLKYEEAITLPKNILIKDENRGLEAYLSSSCLTPLPEFNYSSNTNMFVVVQSQESGDNNNHNDENNDNDGFESTPVLGPPLRSSQDSDTEEEITLDDALEDIVDTENLPQQTSSDNGNNITTSPRGTQSRISHQVSSLAQSTSTNQLTTNITPISNQLNNTNNTPTSSQSNSRNTGTIRSQWNNTPNSPTVTQSHNVQQTSPAMNINTIHFTTVHECKSCLRIFHQRRSLFRHIRDRCRFKFNPQSSDSNMIVLRPPVNMDETIKMMEKEWCTNDIIHFAKGSFHLRFGL